MSKASHSFSGHIRGPLLSICATVAPHSEIEGDGSIPVENSPEITAFASLS